MNADQFREQYAGVFDANERWNHMRYAEGRTVRMGRNSTYIQEPPFFTDLSREVEPIQEIQGARALALLGDSVTTDHISPAGSIAPTAPPANTCRSTAWSRRTSTPTVPAAETTAS